MVCNNLFNTRCNVISNVEISNHFRSEGFDPADFSDAFITLFRPALAKQMRPRGRSCRHGDFTNREGVDFGCADPTYRWVNIYEITRCYGGSEEGGWWYDWHDCVESIRARRGTEENVQKELRERFRDLNVVLYAEDFAEQSQTRRRPHYC